MAATGLDMYVLDAAAAMLKGVPSFIFAPVAFLVYFGLRLNPVYVRYGYRLHAHHGPACCPVWDSRLRSWL